MESFVRRACSAIAGALIPLTFSLLLVANDASATTYPGAIAASFSVGNQGDGRYVIPIDAPSATGGLKPNLALSYNHLAGDGLAGMRVTLDGFSSITRCRMTYAQDGAAAPVAYDANDRFCLDGQRLVGTSGTYGGGGSEYRTELETFQRIKSYGAAGSGPQYFTVEHGNGSISYYGYTADSRIEKVGSSSVRIWYLSFTEDQFGSRIAYGYDENTSTGEVLPGEVLWTSNSGQGLSARYKIAILYESRPSSDQRAGYEPGGAAWARTKRIDKIQVLYNTSTEIATYDLTYSTGISGRSQLASVTQCRGTDCLPATVLSWQDSTSGWNSASSTGRSAGSNPLLGDFDNDGRMDIFVSLSGYWQVYRGKADGGLESAINSWVSSSTYTQHARVADYDGDGRADLFYISGSTWTWNVLKSTGTGFASPINTGIGASTDWGPLITDYDGDGLTDFLYLDSELDLQWRRNTGSGFASAVEVLDFQIMFGDEQYMLVYVDAGTAFVNKPTPDFNGDGRGDYAGTFPLCWAPYPFCSIAYGLALSTSSGYSKTYIGEGVMEEFRVLDVNGDGMDDLLFTGPGTTWYLLMNQGGSLSATPVNTSISDADAASAIVADYNHDGYDDLLRYSSGAYYVYLSNGSTISSSYSTSFSSAPGMSADITGDGFPEIVTASGGLWYTATSATALPDVVTTFTDGLGYAVSVEYASLSQTLGSHYQLSGGTPSPYVRRFAGSRYVVTEETHDNGLNSGDTTREFDHYYDTAYVDYSGRGWLSFNWHVVTDSDQGTNTATWFNQTWPYAGQVELYRLRRNSDDQIIREVDPSLNKVTWATTPNRHFVYSDSTTTKEWEVGGTYNGTQLRTVVDDPTYTTGSYDEVYVSSTTQTITDPSTAETWTTVTSFDRSTDADDWCIGLPGLVTTTKTLPNSNYAVRKLRHYWDSNTCALTEMRDESETSTAKQLKTTITRDGYGNENVVTLDSVDGSATDRVTDTDYDSYGQYPTSVTLGTLGLQNTFTWDYVAGQKASATDPSGLATSWTYDAFGRVASETVPGRSSTISYVSYVGQWPAGLTAFYVRAQHSDGGDDYRFFDKLQREIGTQARLPWGDWRMQSQLYNATGQVATVSKPFVWGETEFTTSISYDLIGRVAQENAPISESTTSGAYTTYTYNGHEVWVTDPENQTTKTVYNAAGDIKQVIDAASGSTSYTYKPFGELATLTDAESNVTTLGYDARGNKTSMSDPNMGSWSYDYNVFGELASQTNALSQTTTLAYDQAGRPTSRSETEGTTSWTYHSSGTGSKGQVYTISGPGHSMLYQYSSTLGAPTLVRRTFDGASYDFEMSYDAYGRLDVLTYPESTSSYRFKADYDYDIYGQLVRVQDGNTSTVFYEIDESDALGRAREVSLGNGLSEFRDYDRAAGYLESIQTGSGGAVQNLSFTWDKVGNLLTRTNASISKTETFTYDALDRLATMQVSGGSTISMYYSAAGRITSRSDLGSYSYSGVNAGPHAVTSVNGVNYAYDANGRMTSRGGDAITWYSYDLAKKIESGSQSTEFSYGVDRQRYKQVQKTGSTIDAMIAYLGTLMETETRGGTTTYRHYVQARDRVVARVERVGTTNTTVYLHRDHQSSVVEVTNSSGTVIDSLAFDAWGLRRNASNWAALGSPFGGTQATERGYTGHEHLDTVGLVNMNGRIQDPTIGRFLSADPIVQAPYSSQSHNRYSYVWNNPLRYTDPSGFEADQDEWNGDEITVIASCAANVSCALWRQKDAGVVFQRWIEESQRQFEEFIKSRSDAQTPQGGQSLSAGVLDETATGVGSFPRGVYRGLRQEARRAGLLGGGEQIQSIYIEDAIIGEVFTVIAENPELSARIGLKVLKDDYAKIAGRVGAGAAATTILRKKVAGGIAGVGMGLSLGVLAAGGDVRTVAENLALDQKIFVTTVDPTRAILPQIGQQRADAIVEGVTAAIEALLTGDSGP